MSDTETIDRLFLELSHFTKAETEKEIALRIERDEAIGARDHFRSEADRLHKCFGTIDRLRVDLAQEKRWGLEAHERAGSVEERLRTKIESLEKIIVNRNLDLRERDEKIEALKNSRFELLDQISALSGEEDFHVVKDEEINEAWKYVMSLPLGSEVRLSVLYALRKFRITHCEECGGFSEVIPVNKSGRKCPACRHGWRIKNEKP